MMDDHFYDILAWLSTRLSPPVLSLGQGIAVLLSLDSAPQSSCFSLLIDGLTDVYHHAWLLFCIFKVFLRNSLQ